MNARGFTLMEVLISIAILSFMMVLIVMITNDSLDNNNIIVREDRELLQIETALDRLNWDFSQIYTPLYHTQRFKVDGNAIVETEKKKKALLENPLYRNGVRFSGPDFMGRPIPFITEEKGEAIEFYTKGHRRRFENSNESEFAWVRYEFRPYRGDEESKKGLLELVRYYSSTNIYDSDINLKELQAMVLTDKVVEYSFLFWNGKRKKWEENLRNVEHGRSILRGLKLNIKWKRASGEIEEFASRTYRTIWPFFRPENLNKIKYQKLNEKKSRDKDENQ